MAFAQSTFVSWVILVVAGLFETGWAVGLKYTDGFTRPAATIVTLVAMAISVGLLGYAAKALPIGTAYAVWTGIGAVGTVLLGIVLFNESVNATRLFFVALIIAGIVGLMAVESKPGAPTAPMSAPISDQRP